MRILMCRPDYYGVEYEINPWMNIKLKVDHEAALKQWEDLYQTIKETGTTVYLVPPERGWPDMVFTANAGLFYEQKIILSHFKYKERQGETSYFKNWFLQAGFHLINDKNPSAAFFEGAGDALSAGNKLFVGFGFRTERGFYEKATYLEQNKLIYCELNNPYFYHLDTCFCPLNENLALWYPDAFTKEAQTNIKKHIELIAVNEDEAKRFACNAVVLGEYVILPNGCPAIANALKERGFIVHTTEMSEYLKSGGACKCLTLRLD